MARISFCQGIDNETKSESGLFYLGFHHLSQKRRLNSGNVLQMF